MPIKQSQARELEANQIGFHLIAFTLMVLDDQLGKIDWLKVLVKR